MAQLSRRVEVIPFIAQWVLMVVVFAQAGVSSAADAPVPENLVVEGPVIARVKATGVQVYVCKADAGGKLAWVLKGPEAKFTGENGLKGTHYAGPGGPTEPTWESTVDGSKVVGSKNAEHASPDADAVPWLRLVAANHDGVGVFARVTFIQRINTTGGKAPPTTGTAKAGDEIRVAYTAEYVFYGPGATTRPANP
jgi:hypothetical protein